MLEGLSVLILILGQPLSSGRLLICGKRGFTYTWSLPEGASLYEIVLERAVSDASRFPKPQRLKDALVKEHEYTLNYSRIPHLM